MPIAPSIGMMEDGIYGKCSAVNWKTENSPYPKMTRDDVEKSVV
jgi:hypothetical protein